MPPSMATRVNGSANTSLGPLGIFGRIRFGRIGFGSDGVGHFSFFFWGAFWGWKRRSSYLEVQKKSILKRCCFVFSPESCKL